MDTPLIIVKLLAMVGAGTIVTGIGVVLAEVIFYLVHLVLPASPSRHPRIN